MTIEIKYCDVPLLVEGKIYKGSPTTRDYPGDPDEFEIDSIYVADSQIDIVNMLSETDLENIQEIVNQEL